MLAPTDVVTLKTQPIVAAQLLRQAGFQVTVRSMDWQTANTVFASQKPPREGGWNMFFTNWGIADIMNPVVNAPLNSRGRKGGWVGWPDDAEMEILRDTFVRASSPEADAFLMSASNACRPVRTLETGVLSNRPRASTSRPLWTKRAKTSPRRPSRRPRGRSRCSVRATSCGWRGRAGPALPGSRARSAGWSPGTGPMRSCSPKSCRHQWHQVGGDCGRFGAGLVWFRPSDRCRSPRRS